MSGLLCLTYFWPSAESWNHKKKKKRIGSIYSLKESVIFQKHQSF
jgi:hypothetical protein